MSESVVSDEYFFLIRFGLKWGKVVTNSSMTTVGFIQSSVIFVKIYKNKL